MGKFMQRDDEQPIKCECKDCGKTFNKGTEGDNEEYCLRCEHLSSESASPASDDFWDESY